MLLKRVRRGLGLVGSVLLIGVLAACSGAVPAPTRSAATPSTATASSAAPAPSDLPAALRDVRSMAVVGDSISVGYDACGALGPCQRANWATGTDPSVQSIATRLGGSDRLAVHDLAVPGAQERDLAGQLARLTAPVDLVVVLAGANDLCTGTAASMTSVDSFAASLRRLLVEVDARAPHATVLLLSVPDVVVLSEVRDVPERIAQARVALGACGSVLGSRGHTVAAGDLAAVQERAVAYDAAIQVACAARSRCIGDGGAVTDHPFAGDQISTVDYFHPSITGQRAIAALAWAALQRAKN